MQRPLTVQQLLRYPEPIIELVHQKFTSLDRADLVTQEVIDETERLLTLVSNDRRVRDFPLIENKAVLSYVVDTVYLSVIGSYKRGGEGFSTAEVASEILKYCLVGLVTKAQYELLERWKEAHFSQIRADFDRFIKSHPSFPRLVFYMDIIDESLAVEGRALVDHMLDGGQNPGSPNPLDIN